MIRQSPQGPSYRSHLYDSYVTGHQGIAPDERARATLGRQIMRHIPSGQTGSILDVGCGVGHLVRALQELGHRDVVGIDVSQEQVEIAHRLGTKSVQHAELFDFALHHRGRFECVVAVDVIEHFDRPTIVDLFRTLRSMLTPGGILIVRTPNGTSPFHGRILYGDLTHGTAYTRRSLEQVAAATGFEHVKTYACRPVGTGLRQLVRRALWAISELLLTAALVAETGEPRGHIVTQNLVAVLTATRDAPADAGGPR